MIRAAEFVLAAMAAAGLHLAAFAALGSGAPAVPEGSPAAGQGGTALVSLMASDASLSALVAAWERPPVVPQAPNPPKTPLPLPESPPPRPAPADPPPAPFAPAPAVAPASPLADALPDMTPPPPAPEPEPAPEPAPPPADSQAAQTAAGQGGTDAAGDDGAATAATVAEGASQDLRAEWGAGIRARIERRKAYPRDAAGAEGTVTLRLTVAADGRLRAVSVLQSSGHAALDAAALRAVERAGRFPPAPRGVQGEATFTLPVSFRP